MHDLVEQFSKCPEDLVERYETALKKIEGIIQQPQLHCPELMYKNDARLTFAWQIARDALYGKPLPIGG